MSAFKNMLVVCLVTVLLGACTTTIMYRNLDWLIPWYVNGMVDISRDQRGELKEQLQPFLHWHREEELQRYLDLIDGIEADLQQPFDAATVRRWFESATDAFERVEVRMLEVAIEFSDSLSDEQLREFRDSMWEQQSELEEEYLPRDLEEWKEDSVGYLAEFIEDFTGRLTDEQQQRIDASASELIRFDQLWLQDRRNWLERIEPLLERPPGWKDELRTAYAERLGLQPGGYQETYEHNLEVYTRVTAETLNDMTPKQRERMLGELDGWRRKLQKMMRSND